MCSALFEFLIYSILIVVIFYLLSLFYCIADNLNISEKLLIVCFAPVINRVNVFHMRAKIFVRKSTQPVY